MAKYYLQYTLLVVFTVFSVVQRTHASVCPGIVIQGIQGGGFNTKIGWNDCGTDCDLKFYLAKDGTSSYKITEKTYTIVDNCAGTFEIEAKSEIEEVQNPSEYIDISFNPTTCTVTATTNTGGTFMKKTMRFGENWSSYCSHDEYVAYDRCQSKETDETGTVEHCVEAISTTGLNVVSTSTESLSCGGSKTTTVYEWRDPSGTSRGTVTEESFSNTDFQNEYTTDRAVDYAKECARVSLNAESFPTDPHIPGTAAASMSIASDQSSASFAEGRWRLAIFGTSAEEQYKITLHWREVVNGKVKQWTEDRYTSGSDDYVMFFPSESGEILSPKESTECNYSYLKELTGGKH